MNKVKVFRCGICKAKEINTAFTRHGLRHHLKEEHRILNRLTNASGSNTAGDKYIKQGWWIEE